MVDGYVMVGAIADRMPSFGQPQQPLLEKIPPPQFLAGPKLPLLTSSYIPSYVDNQNSQVIPRSSSQISW